MKGPNGDFLNKDTVWQVKPDFVSNNSGKPRLAAETILFPVDDWDEEDVIEHIRKQTEEV